MGYDAHLSIHTGKVDHNFLDLGGYTYNVGGMYLRCLGIPFSELRGLGCVEAASLLSTGIRLMKEYPETYKEMNPDNGWGDYDGALRYLEDIYYACIEHPAATLHIY